jgi:phosphoribosyl 1,2-cyclic phosphodiesterase
MNQVNQGLRIKVWGCRGSIATSGQGFLKHGGNTTCFEILSACLPPQLKLFVDAGTGFVPAGYNYLSEVKNGLEFVILFTHYHYDHVQGLTLSPPTFFPSVKMTFAGPRDAGLNPKDVIARTFQKPFFPVDAKSIMQKMMFKTLEGFDVMVIVCHPVGGYQMFDLDEFRRLDAPNGQVRLNHRTYDIRECLVIRMHRANHTDATCITYRFEERTTGKVLVVCTDHEDLSEIPKSLLAHFRDANLLVIDGQYDQGRYETQTAGFGHGTPKGVARQAVAANVRRVGITHHDPLVGTDDYLENEIAASARYAAQDFVTDPEFAKKYGFPVGCSYKITDPDNGGIFLCADYETYVV